MYKINNKNAGKFQKDAWAQLRRPAPATPANYPLYPETPKGERPKKALISVAGRKVHFCL